jgi:uncharacterized membrane protein
VLSALMVVLHVFAVFGLVAGIVGRAICHTRAQRADDLPTLRVSAELGNFFERTLVRPVSLVVLVTGLGAAWARGWPILGFLQGHPVNWVLAALAIYLTIIPVIVFVFLPRARVYEHALVQASAQGTVTPALRAALDDPAVRAARIYEMAMIGALTWLMVAKPF